MKKVGVVLSGCGVYDGAEIHETVSHASSDCPQRRSGRLFRTG